MSTRNRCTSALGLAMVAVYCIPVADAQQCQSKAYTTDSDFDEGFQNNTDRSSSGSVKVNALPVPLPYLSVAKTGAGSVARIDTTTGSIVGDYWTTPGRNADKKQPSRTTVDLFGNTWAANRYEDGYVQPSVQMGSVVKIGLVVGGTEVDSNGVPRYFAPPFDYCTCVDRDDDGVIRTSFGRDDMLEWPDEEDDWRGGGIEGSAALVEEALDECILLYQRTHGTGARHVSVNDLGQVWVGGYSDKDFDLLDGEDGSILATFNVERGAYGGLMDGNGVLWSTQEQGPSGVLRYDTRGTLMLADDWWDYVSLYEAYGSSMDRFGYIWVTQLSSGRVSRLDPFTAYDPEDPTALILESVWTGGAENDRGVAVTWTDDHIWVANSGGGDISRLRKVGGQWTPNVIDLQDPPYNQEFPSGVAVDSDGKLWVTCRGTDYVRRIDPALAGGLGDVDLDVYLGDGAWPYNYSDMTGYVALGALKQAL